MAGRERDDAGFLSRWSERKREAKQSQETAPDTISEDAAAQGGGPAGTASETADAESDAFNPDDLPDIETLDKESDFSVFMHKKVPEALRRRALRRLWQVDPTFAFLDGMNDYDEDYTDAAMVVEGLKTAYQVGKGMVRPEEPDKEEPEKEESENEGPEEGAAAKDEENTEALSAAEEEDTGVPEDLPAVETEPQQAAEDGARPVRAAVQPERPKTSETVESALDTTAARPVSRPPGSALRRRWGDQTG